MSVDFTVKKLKELQYSTQLLLWRMKFYRTTIFKWIFPFLAIVLATAAVPAPVNELENSLSSLELKNLLDEHRQLNRFKVHNMLVLSLVPT